MLAFGNAIEWGYRCLETDVQATRDGVLVTFHDATLDRTTDSSGTLTALPWSQVRQARIGGTEPIPTLDEVLDSFDATVNIDLKSENATELVAGAVHRHRAEDRVCVVSFDDNRLRRFRRLTGGRIATVCTQSAVAAVIGSPSVRLDRGIGGDVFQVPVTHRVGPLRVPVINRRFLERAHALGRPVHAWTINDSEQMHRLIDLGIDGIITDRIDVLREVLTERGLW